MGISWNGERSFGAVYGLSRPAKFNADMRCASVGTTATMMRNTPNPLIPISMASIMAPVEIAGNSAGIMMWFIVCVIPDMV